MARKTGYFSTHYSQHYSHYSEKRALLGTIILPLTGQFKILAT